MKHTYTDIDGTTSTLQLHRIGRWLIRIDGSEIEVELDEPVRESDLAEVTVDLVEVQRWLAGCAGCGRSRELVIAEVITHD